MPTFVVHKPDASKARLVAHVFPRVGDDIRLPPKTKTSPPEIFRVTEVQIPTALGDGPCMLPEVWIE